MSDIRTIDINEGLDVLRSELKYTELRLLSRDETRPYAAAFTALLERWPAVRAGQLAAWDAEDAADVAVANADDDNDDAVLAVDAAILADGHPKGSATHARYLGTDTVKGVQKLGLESQLGRTADWAASLRSAGSPNMGRAADTVAAAQTAGQAALAQRVTAAGARADQRVRVIQAFFDDANALRQSTYGGLLTYAAANHKPVGWARRPFRKGRSHTTKPTE